MRHKLILAGGGSGTAEYLLPAAKKALEEVELVIASPRFLELLHARKTMPMGHISELLESLPAMLDEEDEDWGPTIFDKSEEEELIDDV